MRKVITTLLILVILLAFTASAETLTTLKQVQDAIMESSPRALVHGRDIYVSLTGAVAEIIDVHGSWFIYRIECDEEKAGDAYMFGYAPCFYTWGFDLSIGDAVRVDGKINGLYSSPLVPYITPSEITLVA